MTKTTRNYGIDLLRILSMNMIVLMHILDGANLLQGIPVLSMKYSVVWFLEIASLCSVNCYALISGYVGYRKKFKPSALIQLWGEVVFYLLFFGLLYKIISPESVSGWQLITSCIPVLSNKYWYFTSYAAMYMFTPFMNCLIDKLSFKKNTVLIFTLMAIFSLLPTLSTFKDLSQDAEAVKGGYSPIWLIVLFYIGAYVKKYNIAEKIRRGTSVWTFLLCVLLSLASKAAINYHMELVKRPSSMEKILIRYNSVTILICGLALFVLFAKMDIKSWAKKFISFFASATFGVYIIHLQSNNHALLNRMLEGHDHMAVWKTLLFVFGSTFAVWLICSLIDKLRQFVWKLLRLNLLAEKIEIRIRRDTERILNRYERKLTAPAAIEDVK